MVHITALALFHAAPPRLPRSDGMEPSALPTHAPLTSWGILGGVPPRSTRPLVDSETTPHMEERLAPVLPLLFLFFLFL